MKIKKINKKITTIKKRYFQDFNFLKNFYKNSDLIKKRGDFIKKYSNKKRFLRNLIFELLLPPKNKTILDVGCGNGLFLKKLHKIYPGNDFFGLDIVRNEYCNNLNFLDYRIYNGKLFPYKIQFDYIFCMNVIYHIPNFQLFFNQIKKRLSNNGLFILTAKSKYIFPNIERVFRKIVKDLNIKDSNICKEIDESRFCLENGLKILRKNFSTNHYSIKIYSVKTKLVVDNKKDLIHFIISTARYNLPMKNKSESFISNYINRWEEELALQKIFVDSYIETVYFISKKKILIEI